MKNLRLFMLLLGCKPKGRHTEQHDIFFGIGTELKDLVPAIYEFWPEAQEKIHIDAWREVTSVGGYKISIDAYSSSVVQPKSLFFLNLGGYIKNIFEEFHFKFLTVSSSLADATQQAKETDFFKSTGYPKAPSHVDDKYGIDVDDAFKVEDILAVSFKEKYRIVVKKNMNNNSVEDPITQGYLLLSKL